MSRTATVQQQQQLPEEATTAMTLTRGAAAPSAKAAALRPDEKKLLAQCNDRIDAGLGKCEEGQREIRDALETVHSKFLYREYGTFENYCHEVWGKSPRWARYQLAAASVIRLLEDHNAGVASELPRYDLPHVAEGNGNGDGDGQASMQGELPVPESEKVLRPLSRLPAEEVPEVWRQAVETAPDHKPTAQFTETVVREHIRKKEPQQEEGTEKAKLEVEVPYSMFAQPRGEITQANCLHLFFKGPTEYVRLGNGNVFDHDGSSWVTCSQAFGGSGRPQDCSAECYCLVPAQRYTGREGVDEKESGTLQGYRAILDRKNYRLGPKTIFKVSAAEVAAHLEKVDLAIPSAVKFLKDEKITSGGIHRLQERFKWNYSFSAEVFDTIADRGLLREGENGMNGTIAEDAKEDAETRRVEAKPMVLKTAKILYYTGTGAVGISKKWEQTTAENQTAFLAMAQWHLDLIQQLEGLIEKLNKTIGDQSREITALSRFPEVRAGLAIRGKGEKKRSANLRSKIENRKITMAKKAAAAAFKSVPASGTFLICREADGKKPKYWAGPNAWTIDPFRAKMLSRKKAEDRLQKTRKWDSCKGDSLVSMPEAVRRFGKS